MLILQGDHEGGQQMKNDGFKTRVMFNHNGTRSGLAICATVLMLVFSSGRAFGQYAVQWMDIGPFQSWYLGGGSEYEEARVLVQQDGDRWPAIYPNQDMQAAKGLWIGVRNWKDSSGTVWPYKVVHFGPRWDGDATEFVTLDFSVAGRFQTPHVTVNGSASFENNPVVVGVDPQMKADRIIYDSVATAIGLTMVREIIGFGQQYNNNYIIYDYKFTNTGFTGSRSLPAQALDSVRFFFQYRYAICAETRYVIGSNAAGWGIGTDIDTRGDGLSPASTFFGSEVLKSEPANADNDVRAQYAWLGNYFSQPYGGYSFPGMPGLGVDGAPPSDNIGGPIWGKSLAQPGPPPADTLGRLGAAQFIGIATLHADKSASDTTDDPVEPSTTAYVSSDDPINSQNSQFNKSQMKSEYELMAAGHDVGWINGSVRWKGTRLADTVGIAGDPSMGTTGGLSVANGYGPYTLAPGESVHIVMAEAAAGLSREACIRIGREFKLGQITPVQKDDSVYTGRDSLFQTFRRAIANYQSGYGIPQPPDPPSSFTITSDHGAISLSWTPPTAGPQVDRYRIYRAHGTVDSAYTMIVQCAPGVTAFRDTTVSIRDSYYYYITSVADSAANDGSGNTPPGQLESSRYYTQTYTAASPLTGIEGGGRGTPLTFSLLQNYPNPFNPTTTIVFSVQSSAFVTLKVYDVLGREVATLVSGRESAGEHTVTFSAEGGSAYGGDASRLPSGVYFYRLSARPLSGEAGTFTETKRLMVLK